MTVSSSVAGCGNGMLGFEVQKRCCRLQREQGSEFRAEGLQKACCRDLSIGFGGKLSYKQTRTRKNNTSASRLGFQELRI